MEDFNAKKSRAAKFRQDKYRDRSKKHVHAGAHSEKDHSKAANQGQTSKPYDASEDRTKPPEGNDDIDRNTQTFSKRKLGNNWERYEESVDINKYEDEPDATCANFEELLSVPVSGGHLKLKHEHEWETEKSELQMPWFQLNTQAMEKNLSTLSFLSRQNLPQTIFSDSQLQRIATRAKQNAASISEISDGILKLQTLTIGTDTRKDIDGKVETVKNEPVVDNQLTSAQKQALIIVKDQGEDEDLDSILALHESSLKPEKSETVDITNKFTKEDLLVQNIIPAGGTLQESVTPEPSSDRPASPKPPDSLDDWLDSILDD